MSAAAEAWGNLQAIRVAVLVGFMPVLLYRIWRVARFPASVPALAATAFGASAWFWLLIYSDWVWPSLPPVVHAVSVAGWPPITIAACLQVFVVGIAGDASPARIRRALRTASVMAVLALIAVTVLVTRSRLPMSSDDVYVLAEAVFTEGDPAAVTAVVISSAYVIFVAVQLAWHGFRHIDRTPVGVGLGLMTVASIFQIVACVFGGIWQPLSRGKGVMGSAYGVWLDTWPGCIAEILMFTGFLWPPMVSRVQAHRDVRRLRPVHNALADLFPALFPPMESRIRLSDKVFEWGFHIQDGLTLLAQRRGDPLVAGRPVAEEPSARAGVVAKWLVGQPVPGFSREWLHAPDGVSDESWVLAIADAYRERQEDAEFPASLSGMPSTLRR
ncbi:hypothetical protein [Mycobacteroides abscessus]|uniref:hypothetical protein n=1 Tax=Mycobacteroides abscessus TaxID=36809 RepID=UPI0018964214